MKTVLFMIAFKKKKQTKITLGINLIKGVRDLYNKNYKILMKEM